MLKEYYLRNTYILVIGGIEVIGSNLIKYITKNKNINYFSIN